MVRGTTLLGVGSSEAPPFGYRSGETFSKNARKGAPPVIFGTVKKTRVIFPH